MYLCPLVVGDVVRRHLKLHLQSIRPSLFASLNNLFTEYTFNEYLPTCQSTETPQEFEETLSGTKSFEPESKVRKISLIFVEINSKINRYRTVSLKK